MNRPKTGETFKRLMIVSNDPMIREGLKIRIIEEIYESISKEDIAKFLGLESESKIGRMEHPLA